MFWGGGGVERVIGCLRPVVGWWSALVNLVLRVGACR